MLTNSARQQADNAFASTASLISHAHKFRGQ